MSDAWAEASFRQLDLNQDGLLNYDEMPESLKAEKDKWDTNKDGHIDLNEYKAYWRERMHSARALVEELSERVRQFEQQSKKLESDFYSWDDGQYRDGVIKPAWDKKREELETARKDLEQAEKDLAELPEKARKAGALPGWLRE